MGELRAKLGRNRVDDAEQGFVPVFRIGILERHQPLLVLGRRHLVQQLPELQVLRPDGRGGELVLRGRHARRRAEFFANKDRLERQRGLGALVGGDFAVQHDDCFGDRRVFVG